MTTAAAFLAALSARGCRARDVRDGAHEAFHALTVRMPRGWEREAIHAELVAHLSPSALWVHEMEARRVEQEVCRVLGEDPGGDLEKWIGMSCMEAIRTRVPHCDPERAMAIAERIPDARVARAADRVLRLVPFPADALSW